MLEFIDKYTYIYILILNLKQRNTSVLINNWFFFAGFISSPHQAVGEYQHPGPHRHGGNSDESIHATLQGKSEKTTGFVGGKLMMYMFMYIPGYILLFYRNIAPCF